MPTYTEPIYNWTISSRSNSADRQILDISDTFIKRISFDLSIRYQDFSNRTFTLPSCPLVWSYFNLAPKSPTDCMNFALFKVFIFTSFIFSLWHIFTSVALKSQNVWIRVKQSKKHFKAFWSSSFKYLSFVECCFRLVECRMAILNEGRLIRLVNEIPFIVGPLWITHYESRIEAFHRKANFRQSMKNFNCPGRSGVILRKQSKILYKSL